jgi:hypothetical protein
MVCAFLLCLPALARFPENWPLKRLFDEADVAVIGKAVSTKQIPHTFTDKRWPLEFVGQATTFEVLRVLKGKLPGTHFVLVHFRAEFPSKRNEVVEVIDGPRLVSFPAEGNPRLGGREYLLFLKKGGDGRFEPISGRIDPLYSVRELRMPSRAVERVSPNKPKPCK